MKVIGIAKVDFVDRNDASKRVQGYSIHYVKPFDYEGARGMQADKIFLSDWFITNRMHGEVPDIDDEILFSYNKKGRLENFYITHPTAASK